MKKYIALGTLAALLLALLLWGLPLGWRKFNAFVFGTGHNVLVSRVTSPNGGRDVVIFIRDCGATTRAMTSVSVLKHGEPVEDRDAGNIFRLDDVAGSNSPPIVKAEWDEDGRLLISYDKNYVVKYANNNGADVPVFFRHLSAPGAP